MLPQAIEEAGFARVGEVPRMEQLAKEQPRGDRRGIEDD